MRAALLLLLLAGAPERGPVLVSPSGDEVGYYARNPALGQVFQAAGATGPLRLLVDLSDPSAEAQVASYVAEHHLRPPAKERAGGPAAGASVEHGLVVVGVGGKKRSLVPPPLAGEGDLRAEVAGYAEKGGVAVVAVWRERDPDARVYLAVPLP